LLLSLPNEHQLRFSKYKTAQELWAAILKTSGGNKATKKTKKNLLKQQYGNFKAEGSQTLEQTFNRLQISIQGLDVARFDKLKVECFNCHKMGHFVRECRAPRSQDRGRRDNYRQESKVEEQAPKALMAIDGVGWEWSYMANDEEDHALVADERSDKNKDGLGYSVVPPPPAQLYSSPKKDLSWTGLLKFADDTVTGYSRPSPTVESTSGDDQNRNPSVFETVA
nr:hypothetical protein [Tanacetum cinerariifolium]